MLRRFKKRDMILDADTEQMSAEYFQAIQDNTLFNHLGYDDKAREAYGIVTVELERLSTTLEGPISGSSFVGSGDGRVWGGLRTVQVNLDGTLAETSGITITPNSGVGTFLGDFESAPAATSGVAESYYNTSNGKYYNHSSGSTTWNLYEDFGEYNHKIAGADDFTEEDSYIVMLTVEQFIGVDFNAPSLRNAQVQPLLNPDYDAISYVPPGGTIQRLATNRHDRQLREDDEDRVTRPVFINMSVFEQAQTYFNISAYRTSVWAEVVDPSVVIVPIHDYQRLTRTQEYVIYSPSTDPDPPPAADPPVTFNQTGITSHDRSFMRIAWYAKGV